MKLDTSGVEENNMMYVHKFYVRSARPMTLDATMMISLPRTGKLTRIKPYGSIWEGQGGISSAEFLMNTVNMSGMTLISLVKIVIIKYSKHVREMLEMTKLIPRTIRKN